MKRSNAIAGIEIKLFNEKGVTAWSNKTKEKPQTDQFYLPTLIAEHTEIETDNEEDFWEDISLIVTQDNQHETDTEQSEITTEQTAPTVKTNEENPTTKGPNEVSYEDLDQNSNLANQSNFFDWSNDSFWNRDFTDFIQPENQQTSKTTSRRKKTPTNTSTSH